MGKIMLDIDIERYDENWSVNCFGALHKRIELVGTSRHFPSGPTNIEVKKVIFNNPATIVFWKDGTKTVVKCSKNEKFDPEKGLAMAISEKVLGSYSEFKRVMAVEDSNSGFGKQKA